MRATARRCMPMARRVPISRVRSRMAIHMVFMIPATTMATRMIINTKVNPCRACSVHIMKDSSSSQVVTSSFCPVHSSRLTLSNFIQKACGLGLHHPVAGVGQRLAQRRRCA
jgi:hypothetical protein